MEVLEIVDENNKLTGEIKAREIIHTEGLWHREVAVLIVNENNELLIQKRAATKKQSPNKWALCAGHIDVGEKPEDAVIREVEEEIGYKIPKEELEFLFVQKKDKKISENQINRNFQYIYFTKVNKKIGEYKIQYEELSELRYISINELKEIVNKQDRYYTFISKPYIDEILEVLENKNIENK